MPNLQRWYVATNKVTKVVEVFQAFQPTAESHPQYNGVTGPFRTKHGALFAADPVTGFANNPHCRTVNDAEKLSKESRGK